MFTVEDLWDLGNIPGKGDFEGAQDGVEKWFYGSEHWNMRNCRTQRMKYAHFAETQGWVNGNMMRHHSKSQVSSNACPCEGGVLPGGAPEGARSRPSNTSVPTREPSKP